MKVKIELDLRRESDNYAYKLFNNRNGLIASLTEIRDYLRNKEKNCEDNGEYEKFKEILNENKINAYELL